jgi:hypothetical protein
LSRSNFIRRAGRLLKTGSTHVPDYQRYLSLLEAERSSFAGGTFNLTIDFELGWSRARRDGRSTTRQEALQRAQRARAAFPALLEASDRYAVPITFAVVGHLAMARCEHPPTPAFAPYWLGEDWFAIDPSTDGVRDPAYYAADAIETIARADVAHEIGSHGFSHVDLGDDATTREIAIYEVVESRNALRRYDPAISSFIFPKNHLGFLDVLRDAGFTAYRSGAYLPLDRDEHGMWRFPKGLWLSPQASSPDEVLALADVAIAQQQLIHTWCHLHEYASAKEAGAYFSALFRGLADRRQGGLAVRTMRDVVRERRALSEGDAFAQKS